MAKEEGIRLSGVVIEILPNATFRVQVDDMAKPVFAYIGGKLRMHSINILLNDRVQLEFSPYDMTKCRIIFRN